MKAYYVTIIRDKRVGWLSGPFSHHDDALACVSAARLAAENADPRSVFDAFGTSSIERPDAKSLDEFPRGVLTARGWL